MCLYTECPRRNRQNFRSVFLMLNYTGITQNTCIQTIHNSRTLIPHDSKWKYTNMNPSAPTIKGLIKLHKPDQPIRPVVNWRNAPAYKLAKLFTQKAGHLTPLPNAFNINNSRDLIHTLKDTPVLPHFTLASLDVSNLYTNIPVAETRTIFADILKQNLTDPQTQ